LFCLLIYNGKLFGDYLGAALLKKREKNTKTLQQTLLVLVHQFFFSNEIQLKERLSEM
jgi:hypothetical protein